MYRVLRAADEVHERRRQASHPATVNPELVATGPNSVWSWDITKLLGPEKWTYFHLYVIIDISSRYVPGWLLATRETAELTEHFIAETIRKQTVAADQLTIHADRGTSMGGIDARPSPSAAYISWNSGDSSSKAASGKSLIVRKGWSAGIRLSGSMKTNMLACFFVRRRAAVPPSWCHHSAFLTRSTRTPGQAKSTPCEVPLGAGIAVVSLRVGEGPVVGRGRTSRLRAVVVTVFRSARRSTPRFRPCNYPESPLGSARGDRSQLRRGHR